MKADQVPHAVGARLVPDVPSGLVCVHRRTVVAGLCALLAACGGGGGDVAQRSTAGNPVAEPDPAPVPAPESPSSGPPAADRPTRYVDPAQGSDAADGLSPDTALLSLPPPRSGETVLFRRGTTVVFPGAFEPRVADVQFGAYAAPADAADAALPVWTTAATGSPVLRTGGYEGVVFRQLRLSVLGQETGQPAVRLDVARATAAAVMFEDCVLEGDEGALVGAIAAECTGLAFRRCHFTAQRATQWWSSNGCVFITTGLGVAPYAVRAMVWDDNVVRSPAGPGVLIRSGALNEDDNVSVFAGKFINAEFRRNRVEDCGGTGVFLVCGFHADVRVTEAAAHYGWDGLRFEDNVVANNAASGVSVGPNLHDSERPTVIQRNTVHHNGHLAGTTGGLQLNGLTNALVQDNICTDNWTTAQFDGVNLFMDIISTVSAEMATTGAAGCVIRRNRCSGARGAGGGDYTSWLSAQSLIISDSPANSSNPPSAGIRLYYARSNQVYGNLLENNGSGIACDKSAGNLIFNNTILRCTMGFYEGVGLRSRGNRFFNNVLRDNDWDLYGLETQGWYATAPSTDVITLSAREGSSVELRGPSQFEALPFDPRVRNFSVRETADTAGEAGGFAVVSAHSRTGRLQVSVLRPFSALSFPAGALTIGAVEPHLPGDLQRNARFGAKLGSVRALPAGGDDLTGDLPLNTNFQPPAGSALIGAGLPVPSSALAGRPTDLNGRALGATPTLGAVR